MEPVDSAVLPPGRSSFATLAASNPASCAAIAAAKPQPPAPIASRSSSQSNFMMRVRLEPGPLEPSPEVFLGRELGARTVPHQAAGLEDDRPLHRRQRRLHVLLHDD